MSSTLIGNRRPNYSPVPTMTHSLPHRNAKLSVWKSVYVVGKQMWTQENDSVTEPVHASKVVPTPRTYPVSLNWYPTRWWKWPPISVPILFCLGNFSFSFWGL
jgi:hypothetical protein